MPNQKKAVVTLVAGALSNLAVIGAGLALFEDKPRAIIAGFISMAVAIFLTWRAEK